MGLKVYRVLPAGVTAGLAMALTACSGSAGPPPSSAELTQAVRAVVESNYARFGAGGAGTAGAPRVARVQDLGCSLAPDNRGYLCETIIETGAAARAPRKMTRLVRMVRSNGGWQAVME